MTTPSAAAHPSAAPAPAGRQLVAEALTPDFGFYLGASSRLAERRTPMQHIEILQTPLFGRVMRIDECFMTSERDEFFYHEPMVHLPGVSHGRPRSALVIGGGDGGTIEELLKHPDMARVVLVELDGDVIDMARTWLHSIHRGAFFDRRLDVHIGDGHAYVMQCTERFDQIVLDLTDPFGPAVALYTAEFYAACRRVLAPGGVLSLHIQSPIHRGDTLARIVASVQSAFPIVRPYLQYVPLYGTLWGMAMASDSVDPLRLDAAEIDRRIGDLQLPDLQLYNGATHHAMLAQPNYLRALLATPARPIRDGEALDDPSLDPSLNAAPRVEVVG